MASQPGMVTSVDDMAKLGFTLDDLLARTDASKFGITDAWNSTTTKTKGAFTYNDSTGVGRTDRATSWDEYGLYFQNKPGQGTFNIVDGSITQGEPTVAPPTNIKYALANEYDNTKGDTDITVSFQYETKTTTTVTVTNTVKGVLEVDSNASFGFGLFNFGVNATATVSDQHTTENTQTNEVDTTESFSTIVKAGMESLAPKLFCLDPAL